MAKKALTDVEKQILDKQGALIAPFKDMTDSAAAAHAAAELACKLGMPEDKRAAFIALAAPFGFLGNGSQWAQKWADYKGEARPTRKSAEPNAVALAAAMEALK